MTDFDNDFLFSCSTGIAAGPSTRPPRAVPGSTELSGNERNGAVEKLISKPRRLNSEGYRVAMCLQTNSSSLQAGKKLSLWRENHAGTFQRGNDARLSWVWPGGQDFSQRTVQIRHGEGFVQQGVHRVLSVASRLPGGSDHQDGERRS